MTNQIYLVEKIDPKTTAVLYHFGAFTDYKKADEYCKSLNDNLSGSIYIIEEVSLDIE